MSLKYLRLVPGIYLAVTRQDFLIDLNIFYCPEDGHDVCPIALISSVI